MNKIRIAFSKKQWMLSISMVLLILIVLLWSKMNFAGKHRIINGVEINFQRTNETDIILNKQAALEILQGIIGNPIGQSASEIPLTQLELQLKNIPEIERAIAYISFNGKLTVKITERTPIALVVDNENDYYIDSNSIMFEKRPYQNPSVIVITGNFKQRYAAGKKLTKRNTQKVAVLLKEIYSDRLWRSLFEQCHVDKYNHLLLYPRAGRHSIVLNNVQNIREKLENLRLFYRKALPKVGWNKYREIDISYKDQIVARQRVSFNEQP
jgi:cell division protein FtsQ